MYRHGDVLVAPIESIPTGANPQQHLTLAEGEMTGHSHRIAESGAAVLYEFHRTLYLEVVADQATLVHQEHGPIALPRGFYHVWQQREYSPGAVRYVRD